MNWVFDMPRLLILGVAVLCIFSLGAQAQIQSDSLKWRPPSASDPWLAKDKADHFIVSAFITGCTFYAARQEAHLSYNGGRNLAVGVTISLGFFKELYDGLSGKGHASAKDLTADVLGAGVGYLLLSIR